MQKHLIDYIDNSTDYDIRGLRILLEYFYANKTFKPVMGRGAPKIVSVFGSARAKPETKLYKTAYNMGKLLYQDGYAVMTGASGGVMQGANHGVIDAIREKMLAGNKYKSLETVQRSKRFAALKRKYSIGLKITLPFEPHPNPYLGVFSTFHYFNIRKFYFSSLSHGFIACDGGWGTLDELFEILTLVQTGKAPMMPLIILSDDYSRLKNEIDFLAKKGYISNDDLLLVDYAKKPEEATKIINNFYRRVNKIIYPRGGRTIKIYVKGSVAKRKMKTIEKMVENENSPYDNVSFGSKVIKLTGEPHKTYGYLRRVVNVLNE